MLPGSDDPDRRKRHRRRELVERALRQVPADWYSEELRRAVAKVRWEEVGEDFVPGFERLFHPLDWFAPADCKVVILGGSPYHQVTSDGLQRATGLAFAADPRFPSGPRGREHHQSALRYIFDAVERECGARPGDTSLETWARDGVLLWNLYPTTAPGWEAAHERVGWLEVTREVLDRVRREAPEATWLLWGGPAILMARSIPSGPPPRWRASSSPFRLWAERPYAGHPPFTRAIHFKGLDEIRWTA